jgi:hypothetical protein
MGDCLRREKNFQEKIGNIRQNILILSGSGVILSQGR